MIRADIWKTKYKHIAFAVNTEGHNDVGFAGQVCSRIWAKLAYTGPLANTGPRQFGEILSFKAIGKTFHALVCHSLAENGWKNTPEVLEECLNSLDVSNKETIAIVQIGDGVMGYVGGADEFAILGAMARSEKRLCVYNR